MKITFKVSAINTRVNSSTNEEFISISLSKEVKKTINGCESVGKKYAEHACASTTLKVGDNFVFDSDLYDMREREYVNAEGQPRTANVIYLRADA
jgi:hypothetical protein